MKQTVWIQVPASTANLGPGFDSLGMALNLYAWIGMGFTDRTEIHVYGNHLEGILTDKSNLIYKVAQQVFKKAGLPEQELYIEMASDIPLTRGLGSSASAIVGALYAANTLIGYKLSRDELFQMASKLEQHPDNVGASLFGGIIAAYWDGERAEYIRLHPHEQLEALVAIPDFQLSTSKARNVLPTEIRMKEAVFNIGHASLLVAALATGNLPMIRHAMKDCLHQPYRAPLIPGMERILREAVDHGALGAALSGAGPTMLALVDTRSEQKEELEQFLLEIFTHEGVTAKTLWLFPDLAGVQELKERPNKLAEADRMKEAGNQ
ncbi:homoserine kinase [Paenibacillus larvae]|uniref:Homoserine kinase n=3 Tax=Paenibacillus larvae TaxID=1464 RepID=V9WBU3_9BACL|nr:homoserine kinase [Paenibacillus larvae]AHD06592.1 homoserine kinase ThrB [Paenibacillus larvae subsp. larvae DSM 25430]AQR77588.1 homoserine kinase [Paenibacillus larvae subsp. larvae]AQT84049.1 homoserine kinase [Paenibacillus larvae subsp. pulvifaciens]AQZ45511.1 homoserine kinase [Paenibacillus larvae subsp. pulvifaciens]AVF21345.1 homoserine kinase ThrB [Paenibacillus larvae subsp. larvae]